MNVKELLEKRARLKKKKPNFNRQDSHKIKRIGKSWRKPRGVDSKIGRGFRGYRKKVQTGWGSPKLVKHLHKSGLVAKRVCSERELLDVDAKTQGIIISSNVGMRKKIKIVQEAIKKNIKILNIKDPKKFLDGAFSKIKAQKEKKEAVKKEKEKKKKEVPKKKSIEDKVESEKDRKEREKKEKDKFLIKPDKK